MTTTIDLNEEKLKRAAQVAGTVESSVQKAEKIIAGEVARPEVINRQELGWRQVTFVEAIEQLKLDRANLVRKLSQQASGPLPRGFCLRQTWTTG